MVQEVVDDTGCPRLGKTVFLLADHQSIDSAPIHSVRYLKPGRYALAGVQWGEQYSYADYIGGLSKPDGDFWTFVAGPNEVTNVGVIPVVSPYPHRYDISPPGSAAAPNAARTAAGGVAPIVRANWVLMPIADPASSCPTAPRSH